MHIIFLELALGHFLAHIKDGLDTFEEYLAHCTEDDVFLVACYRDRLDCERDVVLDREWVRKQ